MNEEQNRKLLNWMKAKAQIDIKKEVVILILNLNSMQKIQTKLNANFYKNT